MHAFASSQLQEPSESVRLGMDATQLQSLHACLWCHKLLVCASTILVFFSIVHLYRPFTKQEWLTDLCVYASQLAP